MKLPKNGLYAITPNQHLPPDQLAQLIAAAIDGGAAVIQYRNKGAEARVCRKQAAAVLAVCRQYQVPLVINDDVELACRIGADGVHLGRGDEGLAEARRALGPRALVGYSCYADLQRARWARQQGASYIAFGAMYASSTKPAAERCPLSVLTRAKDEIGLPVVAIGGIKPDNGAPVLSAGADFLAVISAVFTGTKFSPEKVIAQAQQFERLFKNRL